MAIYRADQATVTFAPEVGQGGYMESGDIAASFISTGLGITKAVVPGDRTVSLTGAFNGYATGTAGQADSGIITGNGTTFTAAMVGSTFTFSTGVGGGNIRKFTNTTSITVDTHDVITGTSTAFKIGDNLKTFIILGNNTYLTGPKEIRRVVAGFGTDTITVDTPFGFPHPAVAAAANIVEYMNTTADGTADPVQTDDTGKFITWLPGVYESVDCPDPDQAFEPRYILGSLTKRNFYSMYAGQETLTGSMGGMIMLNGFPLRFPIGKVVTTPVVVAQTSHGHADHGNWNLASDQKAGQTTIHLDQDSGSSQTLAANKYILFGVASSGTVPTGSTHVTDSTATYEIRKTVTSTGSIADDGVGSVQIWPPLSFDHNDDDEIYTIEVNDTTEFLHTIFEEVALTPITWNVSIVDDANTNIWQRRYVGGKVGSMSLSAESGGLLTGGWDGVNFLDMVHNVKSHPSLPANQPMPRYTSMQSITSDKVGTFPSSGTTFNRPATAPYYFSNGIVKMLSPSVGQPYTNQANEVMSAGEATQSGTTVSWVGELNADSKNPAWTSALIGSTFTFLENGGANLGGGVISAVHANGTSLTVATSPSPAIAQQPFKIDTLSSIGIEVARLTSFNLSISNSTEPRYYVGAQHDGRRTPKEQFEGRREYSMSATMGHVDSANQGTHNVADLFKELLLAGDYRGNNGDFKGFGIELKFIRDMASLGGTEKDYIKVTIPSDGTAANGGNEQGAFIRSAPHNINDANPISADADIIFRSMKIDIRDYEPIYP